MAIINEPKDSYTQLGEDMQLEITHNKDFTQSIIRSGETNIRINRTIVPAKEDFVDLLIQTVKQAYRNLEVNNYATTNVDKNKINLTYSSKFELPVPSKNKYIFKYWYCIVDGNEIMLTDSYGKSIIKYPYEYVLNP